MKKATTTNETTFICVKPIIKAEYTIRIVGDSPLLVHAWSEKAKKEMLQAQQGKKLLKKDKVAKNPAGECAEALYWLDGKPDIDYSDWTEDLLHQYGKTARFGFPACAVKAAAISAAYRIGAMKNKVTGNGLFHVFGIDDPEFIEIKTFDESKPKFEMAQDEVKIGMGTSDLRYRPKFYNWYADLRIEYNSGSGMIDLDSILNMIELGGDMCGLGEWRIEKGGSCGKFHVNKNFD